MTKFWKALSATALIAGSVLIGGVSMVSAEATKTDDGSVVAGKGAEFDEDEGKWFLESGDPTYRIKEDGTVDFLTYRGFQRYHAECHVCHGPEGVGSTYAPALIDSLKKLSYSDFIGVVASGRTVKFSNGELSVMPAFGDNVNVMCFLDGIYTYLKARSDGSLGRIGRPASKDPKPKAVGEAESACLDG